MWYDYVKPVQILKRCANNFSRWDRILSRRPGGQILWDHVSRKIFSRIGMTLQSLKTYGYIGSKTKSYWILRGFFLLFIFHIFWPYKADLPCFLILWPYKVVLPCFLICFPFCWELLGLYPRADRIPAIPWIITECLAIYLAALDFSRSDRINHQTRSMRRALWRRQYLTVLYLLRPASRAIGHFRTGGMIQKRP